MRMLARLPGLAYVLDHNGTVYQLPNNGSPGIPVPYPAAEAHAINPEPISLEGGTEAHVRRVADRIRSLPADAVVLVVGHSNTVPLIAGALGETGPSEMADCEYDRLTVISVEDDGDSPAVVTRYGHAVPCRHIRVLEAAHPFPDDNGIAAAREIRA